MQRLGEGRNGKEKNKTCEATNHGFYDARNFRLTYNKIVI
jgi:hypothetical protein